MSQRDTRKDYNYFESLTTRWSDNDVYGHVNNVVYYSYFDTVANSFLIHQAGLDFKNDDIVGFVVNSSCNYYQPVAYPQIIDVGFRVNDIGDKSVQYGLAIFTNDSSGDEASDIVASGTFTHVFVSQSSGESISIPKTTRNALEKMMN